jgi:glutathione synthase/RimK-type ligase-like ATP-grasp enzyme
MQSLIILATAADQPDITPSDQLYAEALRRRGAEVRGAAWNGPPSAFDGADAVVLRSTWGYYRAAQAFAAWTEAVAAGTRLFNPIALVRWNMRKDYLDKLAAAGVRVPQSDLVPAAVETITQVFRERGWPRAVIKPMTGTSGYFVDLVAPHEVAPAIARLPDEVRAGGVIVQEFLPEIADGELSLVYFNGAFSHAVRKQPMQGEFRVNSRFGASRRRETPPAEVVAQGAAVLRALPELPLYARIDGVVRGGGLIVLEVEVLEPALFLDFAPPSAERFADATLRRLFA